MAVEFARASHRMTAAMKFSIKSLVSWFLVLAAVCVAVLCTYPATREQTILVLRELNSLGLWNMATLVLAGVVGSVLISWRKAGIKHVSIFMVYRLDTGHPQYKNVIAFEFRNLLDGPIVLHAPSFRFRKLAPSRYAHGNSATGDFEVKFRLGALTGLAQQDHRSWMTTLLRHRESAISYLPIDDTIEEAQLLRLLRSNGVGHLYLDVVEFRDSHPHVHRLKVPIRNLQPCDFVPPLGAPGPGDSTSS